MPVDWSTITSPLQALNLIFKKKESRNIYQKNNVFQAIALTDGYTLTAQEAKSLQFSFKPRKAEDTKGKESDKKRFSRIYFKGRILGPNSPHSFLPNPKDIVVSEEIDNAIALHTTFVMTTDVKDSVMPKPNEIFTVKLRPGSDNAPFNLQFGDVLYRTSVPKRTRRAAEASAHASAAFKGEYAVPAPPELPVTPGDECWLDDDPDTGDLVYPCLTDAAVRLVVFYHGVGYGDQQFVLEKLKSIGIADNVMFLIPKGEGKPYAAVEQSIKVLEESNNLTIIDKYLGAWSGGSTGFRTAFYYGAGWPDYPEYPFEFSETMLADPSPFQWTEGVTYMEYRPENWTGRLEELGQQQNSMAEQIEGAGGTANYVNLSHDDILVQILKRLAV